LEENDRLAPIRGGVMHELETVVVGSVRPALLDTGCRWTKGFAKTCSSGIIALSVGSRAGGFADRRKSSAHSFLAGYADRESLEIRCVRSTQTLKEKDQTTDLTGGSTTIGLTPGTFVPVDRIEFAPPKAIGDK
jgi:hypothetical protein